MKNERTQPTSANAGGPAPSAWMQYFYANLVWYAFLGAVSFLTYLSAGRLWDDVMADAAKFLFLVLGGGFTLASVLDALYDRYYGTSGEGGRP